MQKHFIDYKRQEDMTFADRIEKAREQIKGDEEALREELGMKPEVNSDEESSGLPAIKTKRDGLPKNSIFSK